MGSFAATCAVSNLPIECGDPVRWLLLNKLNTDEGVVSIGGAWSVRALPLRAEYNDYGSICSWDDPDGHVVNSILDGLKLDLHEQGVGDNTVHDVAVKKDMSFEQLLEAVWEGRVFVKGEDYTAGVPASYTPTIGKIAAIVGESYHVDQLVDTSIRVRAVGYGEELGEARHLIQEAGFAVVETAGSGSSCTRRELRVFTAPGPDHYAENQLERKHLYPVVQMMVREDVWQALLLHKVEHWKRDVMEITHIGIEDFRKGASGIVQALQELNAIDTKTPEQRLEWYEMKNRLRKCIGGNGSGWWRSGGSDHTSHIARMLSVPNAPVERIVNDMAELNLVSRVLHNLRVTPHPGNIHGPQFGDWSEHLAFHTSMCKIAQRVVVEREE